MVYNALKLFMEINPDLFDEAMRQYKQRRVECVLVFRAFLAF
jgi:serine/threonine-protein phosphatase 2A regulatory subunit B'